MNDRAITVTLPNELAALVSELVGYYGDNVDEVATFIVRHWLHTNSAQCAALVDSVKKRKAAGQ